MFESVTGLMEASNDARYQKPCSGMPFATTRQGNVFRSGNRGTGGTPSNLLILRPQARYTCYQR